MQGRGTRGQVPGFLGTWSLVRRTLAACNPKYGHKSQSWRHESPESWSLNLCLETDMCAPPLLPITSLSRTSLMITFFFFFFHDYFHRLSTFAFLRTLCHKKILKIRFYDYDGIQMNILICIKISSWIYGSFFSFYFN